MPLGFYGQPGVNPYYLLRCSLFGCIGEIITVVTEDITEGTGHLIEGAADGLGQAVTDGGDLLGEVGAAIGNVGQAIGGQGEGRKQAVCFSTTGFFYFYCR